MRIVFMGTPDFAVPCLQRLIDEKIDIVCVVTQPDKPQGRRQVMTAPPVKVLAEKYSLNVYQPSSMKKDDTYEYLSAFDCDYYIVAAYGKILPQRILDLPKKGCINVHGSILPKYRGAAPIQWAVLNGDEYTGITTMLMNSGMDTGDILLMKKTPVGESETAGELFDRLAAMSPELLIKTLEKLEKNEIVPVKQDDSLATVAPMLDKSMSEIDWNSSALNIYNKIRGLSPWPLAITTINSVKCKIIASEKTAEHSERTPGSYFSRSGKLYAVCLDGEVLEITQLQPEGSKKMTADAYLRGHPVG